MQERDARAVELLIQALKDEENDVRRGAAKVLDKLGWKPKDDIEKVHYLIAKQQWDELAKLEEPAIEPLIQMLKGKDNYILANAARALGAIRNTRAVEPLCQTLKDKDSDFDFGIRCVLVEALEMIGKPAIEFLIKALKDKHREVRSDAAHALDKLGWEPKDDVEKAHYLIAKQQWYELVELGEPAVEPLIQTLKDEDKYILNNAIQTLGKIGNARAIEPLCRIPKEYDFDVREKVVSALGQIGKPAVEPLSQALKGNDFIVRGIAADVLDLLGWKPRDDIEKAHYLLLKQEWDALAKLGEPAIGPLIQTLNEGRDKHKLWKHRDILSNAIQTLGKIGNTRAVEPLSQALKDNYSYGIRCTLVDALEQIGKPAVESLSMALKDEHKEIRRKVAYKLDLLGWKPRDDIEKAHYLIAKRKWNELVGLGEPAIEPLLHTLKDKNKHTRENVEETLKEIQAKKN